MRRQGKWMHYSIRWPDDNAAVSILRAVLLSFEANWQMQADLARLERSYCETGKLPALAGAPLPVSILS
jgi:hypothetical protein